jgi:sulfur carrier protein
MLPESRVQLPKTPLSLLPALRPHPLLALSRPVLAGLPSLPGITQRAVIVVRPVAPVRYPPPGASRGIHWEMEVTINGKKVALPPGSTLRDVIRLLGLDGGAYAAELNRELVPRDSYEATHLSPGDEIEIVTLVGGG